jgi:hypothetical protein
MDYGYLERQQKYNDKLQKNQFMDIISKYVMPQYTSDNLATTRNYANEATAGLSDQYKTNDVGNVFSGAEFSNAAKKSYDVTNNLNMAEKKYANQYQDWGTNAKNSENMVNYGLGNKAVYNALVNSQDARLADLGIINANRTSTELINKNRLEASKKLMQEQSDRLRKNQNAGSVVDFLSALGAIIGTVYGGPAGGAALGGGIKAGGNAIVKNNYS